MSVRYARYAAILAPLLLAGCVVGQSISGSYVPQATTVAPTGQEVQLVVTDDRAIVKSGDKAAYYVGRYRGGFGNPFDVSTPNKEPLATVLARDLTAELAALGYRTGAAGAPRSLKVSIVEWNFDGYQNGKFWYDLDVRVLDAAGQSLARKRVNGNHFIEGSIWTGAKAGFEKNYPVFYAQAVGKIVREDAEVRAALAPAH